MIFMEKLKVNYILEQLELMFPNAGCELNYSNVFELLIAVVLSAQTTDVRVNIVTKELFKKYNNVYELANADYDECLNIIKSLGLSKNKTTNIINLSKELVSCYNGEVPSNFDDLVTLSGVGRKTANVVLAEGFHIPAIAVDTHVSRVANRLGLSDSNDVFKIEMDLRDKIDKEKWHKAHHLFIHFGRYFCKAQNPKCKECPFRNNCFK